jgi:pimeloyl-ACP methyl ester carboxylesterase
VPQPGCRRGRSAVWPAAGLDRVHLLAHDWGALIGNQLCLRHPRRVQSHLSLSVPPPYFGFGTQLVLTIVRRAWFNLLTPVPLLGPLLTGKGHQRMARYMLLGFTSDRKAFSAQDVKIFVAQLREPARARAGSAPYRNFIQPEAVRILTGSYRSNQLSTPTRVLAGADDPNIRPDILHGFDDHADDLKLKYVDGASHFVAGDRPGAVLERALELSPAEAEGNRPHPPAGRPSLPAQLFPATSAFAELPSATPDLLTGGKPSPKVTALAEKPARERAHCRLIEIEADVAGLP